MNRTLATTAIAFAALVTIGTPALADEPAPYPDMRSCQLADGTTIPEGEYVVYDSSLHELATGSHVMTGMPCGPIITSIGTPASVHTLPATGAATWIMSAVAAALVAAGFGVRRVAR